MRTIPQPSIYCIDRRLALLIRTCNNFLEARTIWPPVTYGVLALRTLESFPECALRETHRKCVTKGRNFFCRRARYVFAEAYYLRAIYAFTEVAKLPTLQRLGGLQLNFYTRGLIRRTSNTYNLTSVLIGAPRIYRPFPFSAIWRSDLFRLFIFSI